MQTKGLQCLYKAWSASLCPEAVQLAFQGGLNGDCPKLQWCILNALPRGLEAALLSNLDSECLRYKWYLLTPLRR